MKESFFHIAEIECLKGTERDAYENSLKYYRDLNNVIETAHEEAYEKGMRSGIEKGIEKGERAKALQIAQKMKAQGIPIQTIQDLTGLNIEEMNFF